MTGKYLRRKLMPRIEANIPPELHDRLLKASAKLGMRRSQFIEMAIEAACARVEGAQSEGD